MKTQKVVDELISKGWIVRQVGTDSYSCGWHNNFSLHTARELHKLNASSAKIGNKWVKMYTGGKDRAKVRDSIKTEKYDDLPTNKRAKEEDHWGWD
jgi:hypothetical protein